MTKAMVLAAGVGSRLEPISFHLPKPLVPVLNTPVITRIFNLLKSHGIRQVISNTHYLSEVIIEHFHNNPIEDMDIQFKFEAELSGDAGGVRACREFFDDGSFLIIMGDLITNADISKLLAAHKAKKAIATIGVKTMDDVTRFGVMKRDEHGFITAFQEKPKADEAISNEISTGIYVLEPEVFDHIPKDGVYGFGRQLFPSLVAKGLPVLGEDIGGYWSDIGTLADLFQANMDALVGKLPLEKPLEHCQRSYPGVSLGNDILIANQTQIASGASIGERCIIGSDCIIEAGASLHDCVLFDGSRVVSGRALSNCIFAFDELVSFDE